MKADPGEVIGPLTIGDGTAATAAPAALTTRTIAAIDRRIGVPPGGRVVRAAPSSLGRDAERCQAKRDARTASGPVMRSTAHPRGALNIQRWPNGSLRSA